MRRLILLGLGAAAAAAAVRYLDRDKLNRAKGTIASHTPSMGDRLEDADDATLARKVETEIFRPADAPKGQVSVDVQAGVVYLRGMVAEEAWIDRLADDAKKVDGIKGVKNLLHRPGTPAPTADPRGGITEER